MIIYLASLTYDLDPTNNTNIIKLYKTIRMIDAVDAMVIYFVLFGEINWCVFHKHTHLAVSHKQTEFLTLT